MNQIVSATELGHLAKYYEAKYPALWQRCYPRSYERTPSGYSSPKLPALQMVELALKVRLGHVDTAELFEFAWTSKLIEHKVPTYWVGHDMAHAVTQTVPPMEFDWLNGPLPHDAVVFMLPRNIVVHPGDQGSAGYVSYARLRAGDTLIDYSGAANAGPFDVSPEKATFIVMVFNEKSQWLMHWTLPPRYNPLNLAKIDGVLEDPKFATHVSGMPGYSESMTREDNLFCAQAARLTFGLLCLMLRRSDLVTPRKHLKTIQRPGEAPREFWEPYYIGKNYKVRIAYVPQGGHHASPRGHWVRGYYRQQACGPELKEHQEIWIEPYWRGGGYGQNQKELEQERPGTGPG